MIHSIYVDSGNWLIVFYANFAVLGKWGWERAHTQVRPLPEIGGGDGDGSRDGDIGAT